LQPDSLQAPAICREHQAGTLTRNQASKHTAYVFDLWRIPSLSLRGGSSDGTACSANFSTGFA